VEIVKLIRIYNKRIERVGIGKTIIILK
jgi:hypothetical protein